VSGLQRKAGVGTEYLIEYLIAGFEPINIGLPKMPQAGSGMIGDGA